MQGKTSDHHQHHHLGVWESGHFLTHSGLSGLVVSIEVSPDFLRSVSTYSGRNVKLNWLHKTVSKLCPIRILFLFFKYVLISLWPIQGHLADCLINLISEIIIPEFLKL